MPRVTVLTLTDSFATAWPALAAEAGADARVVATLDELGDVTSDAAVIVAAGGDEARLVPVLQDLRRPDVPIAGVGAVADHRLASRVVASGAIEYFALPSDRDAVTAWLREAVTAAARRAAATRFAEGEASRHAFGAILGTSPALRDVLDRAARVMRHPGVTVLITGETGTGKELLARAIHYGGPRGAAPFVDVNCAALPEQLLESELFGHEKGSFTGATSAKPGLFELADGGSIFLDEIGHLALPLQGKLLRALQEREIRRVGGTRPLRVDVRVLAATHVDLRAAVRDGLFREDLYYRLSVVPLELPPLRARGDDVLLLADRFLAHFAAEYGLSSAHLASDARAAVAAHAWPGNIRELRNALERAVLLADGPDLSARDVLPEGARVMAGDTLAPSASAAGALPFPATMDDIEQAAARAMVAACDGNKSEAARRLSISRARLLRLLDDAGDPGA